MCVAVNIQSMRGDLRAFGKASKGFIQNKDRLSQLDDQLSMAVSKAKRGNRNMQWSTEIGAGGPILTELSRSYRGQTSLIKKEVYAEVSFRFSGALDLKDDNRFLVRSGGTRVSLRWHNGEGETRCHFDIHPGADGHPMLHVQFDGVVSDIPRIHSFFIHPLDILEFTLMEVFQDRWRQFLSDPTYASAIRRFPINQRRRLHSLLISYAAWINDSESALISLQRTPVAPIELYPPQ